MQIRYINISMALLVLLCACSDKYGSLVRLAPTPRLSFDRDTIVLREKDSLYAARVLNPFVRVFAVPSPPQMHVQYEDASGRVHFRYRGVFMEAGQPIIVAGDSTLLFCACDSAGIYAVDFYLTDHLGKTDMRQLIIHCLENQRPKADLQTLFTDSSLAESWAYRFDASGSVKQHGFISTYYFSVNGLPIYSPSPVLGYTFHLRGEHAVSLFVQDDLGFHSDTITKKIWIP